MGLAELKLKQDCPTRWNSTYDMLRRVLDTKESLIASLALVRNDLSLTPHEWRVIELAVPILKFFYDVTTEVCGEKYVTLSKVSLYHIIMTNNIVTHEKELNDNIPIEIIQLIENLKTGLEIRFHGIESEELPAEATNLDPRFKKKGL